MKPFKLTDPSARKVTLTVEDFDLKEKGCKFPEYSSVILPSEI